MPTIFSHGAIGFAASKLTGESARANKHVILAAIIVAGLPDADALFMRFIPYNHLLGHRGLTHSLFFAVLIGMATAWILMRIEEDRKQSFWMMALFLTIVTASHGFFDALTSGGLGVAFFAPFDDTRYFLPWRPIPVSPLSLSGLLSPRGWRVIKWESLLFWPFAVAAAVWDRQTKWRMMVASVGVAVGVAMWLWAWFER